jgi:hypothetical protein
MRPGAFWHDSEIRLVASDLEIGGRPAANRAREKEMEIAFVRIGTENSAPF